MNTKLTELQEIIGCHFKDKVLLSAAVTHKSMNQSHYEKLEFLGDSILNYCVSSFLYQYYPEMSEGELSIARSKIVNKQSLSSIGMLIDIDQFILVERNQSISPSIRADVIEAIIGATYLDSGMDACRELVRNYFHPLLEKLDPTQLKDAKSTLQEHAHKTKTPAPVYTVIEISGKQHEKVYTVQCSIDALTGKGQSRSKRMAEMLAAKSVLSSLTEEVCE